MVSAGEFWFVVFLVIIALWWWWGMLEVLASSLGVVDVLPTSRRRWIVLKVLAGPLGSRRSPNLREELDSARDSRLCPWDSLHFPIRPCGERSNGSDCAELHRDYVLMLKIVPM